MPQSRDGLSRDRMISVLCYTLIVCGVFLLGVQTGKWLNQPSVKVEGNRSWTLVLR